jgi:hypothetical protein
MKVVNISEGKRGLERLISTFEKTRGFSDFLNCVEHCLDNKLKGLDQLDSIWKLHEKKIKLNNGLLEFTNFLIKINVAYPLENKESNRSEEEEEISKLAEQCANDFNDLHDILTNQDDSYSWFRPAIELSALLSEIYPPELDPGRKIGEHLKIIFNEAASDELSDLYYDYRINSIHKVEYNSRIHNLITTVKNWLLKKLCSEHNIEYLSIYLNEVLDPCNKAGRVNIAKFKNVLTEMMQLPKEAYYLWLHNVLLERECYEFNPNRVLSSDELKTVLNIIPVGKGNSPLTYYKLDTLNWRQIIDDRYIAYSSFFKLIDCCSSYYSDSIELDASCTESVTKIIKGFSEFRHKYLAGTSQIIDIEKCAFPCYILKDIISIDEHDLLLLLIPSYYDCIGPLDITPDISDAHSNIPGVEFTVPTYQSLTDIYNNKQDLYILAFKKAIADGRPDLGTALLALYVFHRAISNQCRFGKLQQLVEAIELAVELPGAKIIQYTIKIVCESISTHYSKDPIKVSALSYLKRFVQSDNKITALSGAKSAAKSDVSERIIKILGLDRWEKLSQKSQEWLISAETLWSNSAMEFGLGMKDWSSLIIPYCKVIEHELVLRLSNFYHSDEYNNYLESIGKKRAGKPTAGTLLYELKAFTVLPDHLKQLLMESDTNLYKDQRLTAKILSLINTYRNKSAHTDIIDMKMYTEFKEQMLHGGILQAFIDTFK